MAETTRNGFKDGNGPGNSAHKGEGKGDLTGTEFADHIMGTTGDDFADGGAGDDVMIGFGGNDTLVGGAGQDNLSGGSGDDTLVGGALAEGDTSVQVGWVLTTDNENNTTDEWTFMGNVSDDAAADTFDAGASFADNGTDTIVGYGEGDVIDLSSALGATLAALDFADDGTVNGSVDLFAGGYLSYDAATGELSVDTDGSAGTGDSLNVWFVVGGTTSETTTGTTFVGETPPADGGFAAPEVVTLLIGTATVETPVVV
jgi:Ca2+-binding RTX toxin-like protein